MTKVFIKTFGCSQNTADSEIMAGLLVKAGFSLVDNAEDSELVIINSCTVKTPTETNFFRHLEEYKKMGRKIVIAGCLPQATPEKVKGYSLIGPSQIQSIVEVVEETLQGNSVTLLVNEKTNKLILPRIRRNKHIEIIPISAGCLGNCAYCIVKLARGDLISYPKEDILKRVRTAVNDNVNQIWITSQDTGCYGFDNDDGYLLPALLKDIARIPGEFKVRLGMLTPDHVLKFTDELIDAFKSEKIYKFLHIPIQSGNDDVLKTMRRRYTTNDILNIMVKFRNEIPDITISTDIICGFPGETKNQFNDSLSFLKKIKPEIVNRSRFWPRPKTEAMSMKGQVKSSETKDRSRQLGFIVEWISFEKNKKWKDWKGFVLIETSGKEGTFIARNFAYKPIILKGKYVPGQRVYARVVSTTIYHLRAVEERIS